VPNVTRPAEAFLGRVAVDEVEFPDVFMYGPNSGKARRHETRFPVAGAWS
jgi:methyl coenzyme M reductase subunit D